MLVVEPKDKPSKPVTVSEVVNKLADANLEASSKSTDKARDIKPRDTKARVSNKPAPTKPVGVTKPNNNKTADSIAVLKQALAGKSARIADLEEQLREVHALRRENNKLKLQVQGLRNENLQLQLQHAQYVANNQPAPAPAPAPAASLPPIIINSGVSPHSRYPPAHQQQVIQNPLPGYDYTRHAAHSDSVATRLARKYLKKQGTPYVPRRRR